MKLGKLVQWQKTSIKLVVFISHQWAGLLHPDPEFKQFAVLQSALLNLAAGSVDMQLDCISAINNIHLQTPSVQQQRRCLEWDFWYDYFGCPQLEVDGAGSMTPSIERVVRSIPAYCSIANFTLVLSPAIEHSDTSEVISERTWNNRGWCRLERAATAFSADNKCILVVSSATRMIVTAGPDWVKAWPAEGLFTLDSDREVVRAVTARLMEIKISSLRRQKEMEKWRFYTALLPKANGYQGRQFDENVGEFLQRYELTAAPCWWGSPVLTPLILASIEGNLAVMHGLLQQKANVNQLVSWQLPEAHIGGHHTALSMAAMLSTKEAVKVLLDWNAALDTAKNMNNPSTLSIASYFGNADVLQLLLKHRADIKACDDAGSNPLHVGAFSPNPRVTGILLKHGAEPNAFCFVGATPLSMTSICNADASHAELMLKAHADPNLKGPPIGCLHTALSWISKQKIRLESASELEWNLAVANDGTPLHLAAINGSLEIAKLLLKYRADLEAVWGDEKLTPKDLAQRRGHQDMVALLEGKFLGKYRSFSTIFTHSSSCGSPTELDDSRSSLSRQVSPKLMGAEFGGTLCNV